MAKYQLNDEEERYSREAVHALNLQSESLRLNNNYKLHESCALHHILLDDSNLPALWRSILSMSMASLDTDRWKRHLEVAVCAWKETGRTPGDQLWEEMRTQLRRLVTVVEEKKLREAKLESGEESGRSSESSDRRSVDGSNGGVGAEIEGETDADLIALAFKLLGM